MSYKPLNLPYLHNAYDGVPIPIFILPKRYEEIREIHKTRPDDIYISTYQKSGTTWLQYILYQMLDEPQGKLENIGKSVPWHVTCTQVELDDMVSPRIFKTHDKWEWTPKENGVKHIYCYRNPKDVAVSYFNHILCFKQDYEYSGSFNEYFDDIFLTRGACEHGYYFDHVSDWLKQKDNPNILFLTYEDMVEDLEREIRRIAKFINHDMEEEKLNRIINCSTFSAMQNNDKVNASWKVAKDSNRKFIRKGKVGDWTNYLSEEQSEELEKLVNEYLIPLGAKIRYTLQ